MKTAVPHRFHETLHPILYEVNARVLLNDLGAREGTRLTLGTIPDHVLQEWEDLRFDAVWLMGVWTTGDLGRDIARTFPDLQEEYRRALPDCTPEDVAGSPYAIRSYTVARELGGDRGLQTLRRRLAERGIGLVLDFVSNHTARDCPWVNDRPELYVQGNTGDEAARPDRYFRAATSLGQKVIAFGRDPMYPGWTDTAQLNLLSSDTRAAALDVLKKIAARCDGVRCDMAMLALRDVFLRTWGESLLPTAGRAAQVEYWKELIDAVRADYPAFRFLAEAYWNREWDLQQLGFDFTYDKVLYDRLLREGAAAARDHLRAEMEYQLRSCRFLENHDEPRAASVLSSNGWNCAAAAVLLTVPGMVLLHDGQLDGRRIRLPVQLVRRTPEARNDVVRSFYERMLSCVSHPVFRKGTWRMVNLRPAWGENQSWRNFLVFWWDGGGEGSRMVVVNYAPHSSQCYAEVPLTDQPGGTLEFRDLLGESVYTREKHALAARGMYFDLPPYGIHVFEVSAARR